MLEMALPKECKKGSKFPTMEFGLGLPTLIQEISPEGKAHTAAFHEGPAPTG